MDHMGHGGASGAAPAGKVSRPEHGTWEGHVLPGSFFVIWSLWWLFSGFRLYIKAGGKRPYKCRSWYEFPSAGSKYPVEPFLKILLPFVGINAELWAGHVSYRRMYDPSTGRFEQGNIQDWQHAAMYSAFICSGITDLIGFYAKPGTLPHGTEHGFLGIAFLVEGLLFAFHLKGTALDMKLHLLLVLVIFFTSAMCFAEIQHPQSMLLSTTRADLTLLQGVWFNQIAEILFKDKPAWDPTSHASVMMLPFFFVMWLMVVSMATMAAFVGGSIYCRRRQPYSALGREDDSWGSPNGHAPKQEIEISGGADHHN